MSELQVSARVTVHPGQLERFREQVTDCTGRNVVYVEWVVFLGLGAVILALAVSRNPTTLSKTCEWKGVSGHADSSDLAHYR